AGFGFGPGRLAFALERANCVGPSPDAASLTSRSITTGSFFHHLSSSRRVSLASHEADHDRGGSPSFCKGKRAHRERPAQAVPSRRRHGESRRSKLERQVPCPRRFS